MGPVGSESTRVELINDQGGPGCPLGAHEKRGQDLESARVELMQGRGSAQISSIRADSTTGVQNKRNAT